MLRETFEEIVQAAARACHELYGERLVSLAVFGSVARGAMRPDSDIDLLVVAAPLPNGRGPRVREFSPVDEAAEPLIRQASKAGVHTILAPIFKTPAEVERCSPFFLDMTETVRILFDRAGFLRRYLDGLTARMASLGSRKIPFKGGYYWLLKPDLKPGEDIEL